MANSNSVFSEKEGGGEGSVARVIGDVLWSEIVQQRLLMLQNSRPVAEFTISILFICYVLRFITL